MNNTLDIQLLKSYIAQSKTQEVFDRLLFPPIEIDKDLKNEVILLSGEWEEYLRDKRKGIKPDDQLAITRRQIDDNLLQILDKLAASTPQASTAARPTTMPDTKPKKWRNILAAIAATIAVFAGIAEITGYSLRDCFSKKEETATVTPSKDTTVTSPKDTTVPQPETPPDPPPEEEEETKPPAESVVTPTDSVTPPNRTLLAETLKIECKTNKVGNNLTFRNGEELHLYFRANRICMLRIIYKLADGRLTLLEEDRKVITNELNTWVELGDGYTIEPPYGVEELYIFAQNAPFISVHTETTPDGYTLITEGLPDALNKSRGLKKKQAFSEAILNITTLEK